MRQIVSVPAIGIWGLRPLYAEPALEYLLRFSPGDRDLGFASPANPTPKCGPQLVSVPAIGIWGLRLQQRLAKKPKQSSFSPGDRDLGFASKSDDAVKAYRAYVSVPAIGIWGLRPFALLEVINYCLLFQSRRSGFGVCVSY